MQNSRLVELAIHGLEAEKARIEQEIAELRNQTTTRTSTSRTPVRQQPHANVRPTTRKRRMSAAARKRISESMKRSHAERKAAAGSKK